MAEVRVSLTVMTAVATSATADSGIAARGSGLESFVAEAQGVGSVSTDASSHARADPTGTGEAEQA